MRELSPERMRKLTLKAFKRAKKTCRRRIREIAKQGCDYATINKGEFGMEDELIAWLESLGFRVVDGYLRYAIYWRDEK
jgi:hypothetical protein